MFNRIIPIAKESGIEIITMEAARKPSGKSVNATKRMAMIKSFNKPLRRVLTFSA